MKFQICRLKFLSELHIGNGLLADSAYTMYSDTFFSALCHEALKIDGESGITKLVTLAEEDQIVFSDGFPYRKEKLFVPKPLKSGYLSEIIAADTSSVTRKALKKLRYISDSILLEENAEFDVQDELNQIKEIGCSRVRMKASIKGLKEPEPYGVGGFHFQNGNGIYFMIGYNKEQQLNYLKVLLESLQYTGIGGKLSTGMGKFECNLEEPNPALAQHLFFGKGAETQENVMTLSVSYPMNQLEEIMKECSASIIKRSGFVASSTYTSKMQDIEGYTKKKDAFVFQSGSCFAHGFEGKILNVSCGGAHPVYRNAKPLFWRLGI